MPDGYPQGGLAVIVCSYGKGMSVFYDFLQKCGCGNVAVFIEKSFLVNIYIIFLYFSNTFLVKYIATFPQIYKRHQKDAWLRHFPV